MSPIYRFSALCTALFVLVFVPMPAVSAVPATFLSDFGGCSGVCAMESLNQGMWLAVLDADGHGQIWFSGGSPGEAALVKEVTNFDVSTGFFADKRYRFDGAVYFTITHPPDYTLAELWMSDGTAGNTRHLASFSAIMGFMTDFNGQVLFSAFNPAPEFSHLWRTDGTVAGTVRVDNVLSNFGASLLHNVKLGNAVYFAGEDTTHGQELWRTDATTAGTYMVKELNPLAIYHGVQSGLYLAGGSIYFTGFVGEGQEALYRSDGTANGTVLIHDFGPLPPDVYGVPQLAPLGDSMFFLVHDGVHGFEPWLSDGTPQGTALIEDIYPGEASSGTNPPVVFDGAAFFMADDGVNGLQVWKASSVEGGADMVLQLPPDPQIPSQNVFLHNVAGNGLYFGHAVHRTEVLYYDIYELTGADDEPAPLASVPGGIDTATLKFWNFGGIVYFGDSETFYFVKDQVLEPLVLEDGSMTAEAKCIPEPVFVNDYLYLWADGLWVYDTLDFRFTRLPRSQWREEGERLLLEVACRSRVGGLTYQWTKDGFDIPDATGATYEVESLTEEDEAWYTCRVTDGASVVHETPQVLVEVFGAGQLPAAGVAALAVLAVACALTGAGIVLRKK